MTQLRVWDVGKRENISTTDLDIDLYIEVTQLRIWDGGKRENISTIDLDIDYIYSGTQKMWMSITDSNNWHMQNEPQIMWEVD